MAKCAICLESVCFGTAVSSLPCGHCLHKACLLELRRYGVNELCPFCRKTSPELRSLQHLILDAAVLLVRAERYNVAGDSDQSRSALSKAEALLREAHDLESNLTTMSGLAACILGQQMSLCPELCEHAACRGRLQEALDLAQQAAAVAQKEGKDVAAGEACLSSAQLFELLGEAEASMQAAENAVRLTAADRLANLKARRRLGDASLLLEQWDRAATELHAAKHGYEELVRSAAEPEVPSLRHEIGHTANVLALALFYSERVEEARKELESAKGSGFPDVQHTAEELLSFVDEMTQSESMVRKRAKVGHPP